MMVMVIMTIKTPTVLTVVAVNVLRVHVAILLMDVIFQQELPVVPILSVMLLEAVLPVTPLVNIGMEPLALLVSLVIIVLVVRI